MKRIKIVSILSVILLFFVACSDDDNPVGTDDLSSEDVELMMEAFQNAGILGGPFMSFAGSMSPNKAEKSVSVLSDEHFQDFDQDIPCPEGGSANYQGSVDQGENHLNADLSVTLNACTSLDGEDNSWTFDGNLEYGLNFEGDEESFEMNGFHEGIVDFSGHLEGSCDIDVSYSVTGDQTGGSGQINGTVCGYDISTSI